MMLKEKIKEWNRVIKLSRKPGRREFIMIAKITGLGMVIIGAIGFIIRMLLQITGISL
ncbi:MAG: protein translocase SEC61 complex subunit gamma [Candidatus Hydrothermarchaeaceae archaeon]